MPSITIRERDLTSAGNLEVTTNTVYIPGYSNMGPINTPTLCETLEEFQFIFGTEPYKFNSSQAWPTAANEFEATSKNGPYYSSMGNFYEVGEFEKSYIMAVELLKLGLPVLYERVFDVDGAGTAGSGVNLTKWTPITKIYNINNPPSGAIIDEKGTIECVEVAASTPGRASHKVYFTLTRVENVLLKNNTYGVYYKLSVGRDADSFLGISKIEEVVTQFTFNSQLASEYSNCIMIYQGQTLTDNSGLLSLKFKNTQDVKLYSIEGDANNSPILHKYTLNVPDAIADTDDEFTVSSMYRAFGNSKKDESTGEYLGLYKLLDKGEYIIKFITTGAYPIFEYGGNILTSNVIKLAAERGDCTALIDHTPNNERTLIALNQNSVYYKAAKYIETTNMLNALGEDASTYAAMFTPYGIYNCTSVGKHVMLPASYGYLSALAASVQSNGNWMAIAGITRGAVPNLVSLCQNLTNAIADSYQNRDYVSINPITHVKPYGLTVWGSRTLKNNVKKGDLTATSFLNIRQLTNDVKRTVWVAAKTLTFEQNSDILWINFKSKIIPTLDQMVSGGGLSVYEIKKQKTDKKATIKAVVRLYAIEPVEDWDITIELADSSTTVVG